MQGVKLFARDHAGFVLFEVFIVAFILLLYWLDGFRNVDTAIYSIIISIVLTCTFLASRYVMRQSYYQKVIQMPKTMDDALQNNAKTPEHMQVELYMHELYRIYQLEAQELYAKQNRHLQFMNQWVHQMKTPLAVMELLLQEEGPLDKKSVEEEVERLKHGLESVLMNARLDTFEEDMKIEKVSLKQIVTGVVNQHKRLFITKRVFPTIDIDDMIEVTTDSKWLQFIIGQFLTNAVKYTFEEGKKVYISSENSDHGVSLKIRDEGIGIPPNDLKRVTKAFFTGENGRKTGESTGMGLFLAQEICKKLDHHMKIESQVDEGTTITIYFKYS
ncbi:sensor histidine kinase [Kurthia sibirica]|uniref:histidine kinase n=1 Tax=Kurthia sibirica TaxID=202750 RepID=A0A2U3AJ99_9BACL|nr:sensor histidine kinase [Kurthia sibirica]PWI24636.1 sensor histidine kinase [Kurthia sibirica]GEK33467.1 sensor histidine kinase [Kurthia sibirica]